MSNITRIEIPIPFPMGSVNIYFIEDSIPTLIDAGFHSMESLSVLENALGKKGVRLSDIKRILLTHGHLDHVGLAGKIQQFGKAKVFIHSRDRDKCIWDVETYAARKKEPFFRFFREGGLPEDIVEIIADEMDVNFKSFYPGDFEVENLEGKGCVTFDDFTLNVIHCPGHTFGSVCFFDQENGRFFSGDHLLEKITPNPVVELDSKETDIGYKSLSHYMESLVLTEHLDVKEVLPGHGVPFYEHRKLIKKIKEHHGEREEKIFQILNSHLKAKDGMDLYTITIGIFPELSGWDIFLGMSETVGHLQILEEKGLITSRMDREFRVYRAGNE